VPGGKDQRVLAGAPGENDKNARYGQVGPKKKKQGPPVGRGRVWSQGWYNEGRSEGVGPALKCRTSRAIQERIPNATRLVGTHMTPPRN